MKTNACKGKHDCGTARSGEVGKAGSLADGSGQSEQIGKATNAPSMKPAGPINPSRVRDVANGK